MSNKIKKILVVFGLVMVLSVGCGGQNGAASDTTEAEVTTSYEKTETSLNETEELDIEGMDEMSDEELNEELIRQAEEEEVYPDK